MTFTKAKQYPIFFSPRAAIDSLRAEDQARLPYPSNALPGARDVKTPYGTMRVYEWGPDDGRKVLFLHGLSTPAPALGGVAKALVEKHCRVMLLDLWGRGYSDTPSDLPHDLRLFTSQIILAVSTSPLSWTGNKTGGFALIGYSMGGGVAMAFAEYFPQLISSLILIGPGGLYDKLPREYRALPVRYPWLFPRAYMKHFIRRLLNAPARSFQGEQKRSTDSVTREDQISASQSIDQAPGHDLPIDVYGIVDSEIDHHEGFVYSIISSIRHAPSVRQHASWQRVGSYLNCSPESATVSGLHNRLWAKNVLLMVAEDDSVLPMKRFLSEAIAALRPGNVQIARFDGDHVFPIIHPQKVADCIYSFWTSEEP